MAGVTQTPNIKLSLVPADFKNWADIANGNSKLLDALMSAYFSVQNLQGLWQNSTVYAVGDSVVDKDTSVVFKVLIAHTSAKIPTTFAQDRTAHPSYWAVYSSPARSRGIWMSNTSYGLNDFVVSGSQYAICIQENVSGTNFQVDTVLGYWSVLVDLANVGSAVLPVPQGIPDADKVVVTPASGNGYTIISVDQLLALMGTTTLGKIILQAADTATVLNAILAQPLDATLENIAQKPYADFGISLLALANVAALQALIQVPTNNIKAICQISADGSLNTGAPNFGVGATGRSAVTGKYFITLPPPFLNTNVPLVYVSVPDGTNATARVAGRSNGLITINVRDLSGALVDSNVDVMIVTL